MAITLWGSHFGEVPKSLGSHNLGEGGQHFISQICLGFKICRGLTYMGGVDKHFWGQNIWGGQHFLWLKKFDGLNILCEYQLRVVQFFGLKLLGVNILG